MTDNEMERQMTLHNDYTVGIVSRQRHSEYLAHAAEDRLARLLPRRTSWWRRLFRLDGARSDVFELSSMDHGQPPGTGLKINQVHIAQPVAQHSVDRRSRPVGMAESSIPGHVVSARASTRRRVVVAVSLPLTSTRPNMGRTPDAASSVDDFPGEVSTHHLCRELLMPFACAGEPFELADMSDVPHSSPTEGVRHA